MAFVPNTGCSYALTTDTGAVFRWGTVAKLAGHLAAHPNCVAVTGRQRVMSEAHQRAPAGASRQLGQSGSEREPLLQWALRCLQGFDFELDHTSGKAANCAAGLLPCLHGPCAMFRYADIAGRTLEEYFHVWGYAAPHVLGLLGANLQLAEDRIPSLLGVIYSGKHTDSPLDAIFEFEAELSLSSLITQRRRWGNGSLAGLIYAITQADALMAYTHSRAFKMRNLALLSLQTLGFVLTFLTPALFGFLFSAATGALATELFDASRAASVQGLTSGIYVTLYVSLVYTHVKRVEGDCVLQPSVLKMCIAYNAAMSLLVVAALVLDAVMYDSWGVLGAYTLLMSVPFVIATVARSGEAVRVMMHAFPVYLLAVPTFIGFLSAYNLARLPDLSWGNRPTASAAQQKRLRASLSLDGAEQQALEHEFWLARQVRGCQLFNSGLVLLNLLLMGCGQTLASKVARLPRRAQSSGEVNAYDGALELCLLFSAPYVSQQAIALAFHATRSLSLSLAYHGVAFAPTSPMKLRKRLDKEEALRVKNEALEEALDQAVRTERKPTPPNWTSRTAGGKLAGQRALRPPANRIGRAQRELSGTNRLCRRRALKSRPSQQLRRRRHPCRSNWAPPTTRPILEVTLGGRSRRTTQTLSSSRSRMAKRHRSRHKRHRP